MKKQIYTAIASLLIMSLAGCDQSGNVSDVPSAAEEAVTETETESVTEAETEEVTEVGTVPRTEAVTGTTEEPETEPATEAATYYARSIELKNTDFGTRPVPDIYYENGNIASSFGRARTAIEEGREMLGSCEHYCIDYDNDRVFVCMYYGYETVSFQIRKGYTFYRIDVDTGEITELCTDDDSELRNVHTMFCMNGRLLVPTYHGFYEINEDTGELSVIDRYFEPAGGMGYVRDGKVYLVCIHSSDEEGGGLYPEFVMYDPADGTTTATDDIGLIDSPEKIGLWEYSHLNDKLTVTGEEYKEETYLIEWDMRTE